MCAGLQKFMNFLKTSGPRNCPNSEALCLFNLHPFVAFQKRSKTGTERFRRVFEWSQMDANRKRFGGSEFRHFLGPELFHVNLLKGSWNFGILHLCNYGSDHEEKTRLILDVRCADCIVHVLCIPLHRVELPAWRDLHEEDAKSMVLIINQITSQIKRRHFLRRQVESWIYILASLWMHVHIVNPCACSNATPQADTKTDLFLHVKSKHTLLTMRFDRPGRFQVGDNMPGHKDTRGQRSNARATIIPHPLSLCFDVELAKRN